MRSNGVSSSRSSATTSLVGPAEPESRSPDEAASSQVAAFLDRLGAVWPLAARAREGSALRVRANVLAKRADELAQQDAQREELEATLTALLRDAAAAAVEGGTAAASESETDEFAEPLAADAFLPMRLAGDALDRSRRELATPEWALAEGLRQVAFYNLARGARDLKMLRGTRQETGALWELRHRDAHLPVRIFYRQTELGPIATAILAKGNDAHQRRAIARVRTW